MLLLQTKTLAIFFGLATTAFFVATIVLAVKKSNLEDELQDALHKLDTVSSLTTTDITRPTSTTLSTEQMSTTGSIHSPETNPSTEFTRPTNGPTVPTLPTGLPHPEKIIYRLPNNIRPIKYKLYIHPDLKSKICEGTVSIQIEIDTVTNLIVLHAKALEINSLSILHMMNRMRIRIKKFYLHVEREMLFIELDELLFTKTLYALSISYNCLLNGLAGLYASSYFEDGGEQR